MENPASKIDNAPQHQEDARLFVFLRTMLSAAVFGALGTWVGAHLGKLGNAPGRNMARPIIKWSLGAFSAMIAAYSSLKVGERRLASGKQEFPMEDEKTPVTVAPRSEAPEVNIDPAGAETLGKLAETFERIRA